VVVLKQRQQLSKMNGGKHKKVGTYQFQAKKVVLLMNVQDA
jgi:hypothetical protein